uniref:Uncharacterized protein n=1 Tax=Amphimedon queenslandica TaxID=400682 RepID=A0A1X7SS42_AMPQE
MDDKGNKDLDVQDDAEIQPVDSPNENLPREPSEEPQTTILPEEHKEKLKQKPVHILFTGLSGAGKSTLVILCWEKLLFKLAVDQIPLKLQKVMKETLRE